jgi:hypothetical protein
MMFKKQEVKIGLFKMNVVAKKRKKDLALLTADMSAIGAEVKLWHKAHRDLILAEMWSPSASSTPLLSSNPTPTSATPKAPSTPAEEDDLLTI